MPTVTTCSIPAAVSAASSSAAGRTPRKTCQRARSHTVGRCGQLCRMGQGVRRRLHAARVPSWSGCAAVRCSPHLRSSPTLTRLCTLSLISVIISTSWGAVLPPPPDPMGWRSLTPSWPAHPYTPGESSSTGIAARGAVDFSPPPCKFACYISGLCAGQRSADTPPDLASATTDATDSSFR